MKLKLDVWERVMLTIITGQVQGNVAMMRKAIKALDVLELSETEKRQVGFATLPDGTLRWDNSAPAFDLEIKDKEAAALVKRVFREYAGWQGTDARRVLALEDKLGLGSLGSLGSENMQEASTDVGIEEG